MVKLRGAMCLLAWLGLLSLWTPRLQAAMTLTTTWERPVVLKVVDGASGEVLGQPLLIVKTEKRAEGLAEAVPFYEVILGSAAGLADCKVNQNNPSAEIRVVVPGYALATHSRPWQGLPARQTDAAGFDTGVPTVTLAVNALGKASAWQREFRLVILPELEELQQLQPPHLSRDGQRIIREFINRERNRMLGL